MFKHPSIVLFGPPGSGKSSAGKRLVKRYSGLHYVATGDLVREVLASDVESEWSQEIRAHAPKGKLVPDNIVIDLFKSYVDGITRLGQYVPGKDILVIDGAPRTRAQAEAMYEFLYLGCVLHFTNLPNEELRRRCRGRSVRAARVSEARSDDVRDAIENRIKEYYEVTFPTLDVFIERHVRLYGVDALGDHNWVDVAIDKHVERYLERRRR